jgi:hypothetical protein
MSKAEIKIANNCSIMLFLCLISSYFIDLRSILSVSRRFNINKYFLLLFFQYIALKILIRILGYL